MPPFDAINALDEPGFTRVFGAVYEHAPWIAAAAWTRRPFPDAEALLAAFIDTVAAAPDTRRMELIRAHPDLAGKLSRAGKLTAHSTEEQKAAGLDFLTDDERARFTRLNDAYRERFRFPFIICAKEHGKDAILRIFERRLENDPDAEKAEALRQIHRIARLRVDAILEESPWEK